MPTEMSIRELYGLTSTGTQYEKDQIEYVQLQGWVRSNRSGKNVSFIALMMELTIRMHRSFILLIH